MRSSVLWLLKPWVVALAFKRYIHKHGKKLGPYYYENIRGQDGNVKTIYVGTNPHQHPKHRIRRPLFFIILVLILILISGSLLFFMQNKAYIIKKVKLQQPDFDVDQILLKVLVKSKESLQKEIRVTNTGSEQASINIEALGLNDIIKIDSPFFEISPSQTKIVSLNFSTFDPGKNTEQIPGIYIGKLIVQSKKASKEIPAVVEVETKRVLFDLNLNPVAFERKVKQGTDTTIEVKLYNLESIESTNVDVGYFVKDTGGNTIVTESETVVVNTQASFLKTISIPKNLKPGPYVFAAEAKFGSSIGTASYLFEVVGPDSEETSFTNLCKNNVLCLGLSLATVLLLFALMAYFYFFVGAYLYEKFTGMAALPRKIKKKEQDEEYEENEENYKPGIFDKIKNKFDTLKKEIGEWKEEKEKARAEKAKLKKEEEIKKQKEEEQKEREKTKLEREQELRRQKETEQKKREELREQQEIEKQKLAEESRNPSKKLQKFYSLLDEAQEALSQNDVSKIDKLYIQESDLYIGMKNREKQEAYSKLMELYKQRSKLLEDKNKNEELTKKERLQKQQKEEMTQKQQEKENIKKQKELENQKAEQEKLQKLERIKRLEESLNENKKISDELNAELKKLESEKDSMSSDAAGINSEIKSIDDEIASSSEQIDELTSQKETLAEEYKKQTSDSMSKEAQRNAREQKLKELKAGFAAKQNALAAQLENELSQMAPEKRRKIEKWKRLELDAVLKIEEKEIQKELKNFDLQFSGRKKEAENNCKKARQEIGKHQQEIKKSIEESERKKQSILAENKNTLKDLTKKEREIENTRKKIENSSREREQIILELTSLKPLSKLKFGFFGTFIPMLKQKIQGKLKENEEKKAISETAEKIGKDLKQKNPDKKPAKREKPKQEQILEMLEWKIKGRLDEEKPVKDIKKSWLEKLFKKEREPKFKEAEEKPEESQEQAKPNFFGKLFGKIEARKPAEEKENIEVKKEEPQKKESEKSEADELEDSIRKLGLFKKIEKTELGIEEEKKKRNIFGKIFGNKEKNNEEKQQKPKPEVKKIESAANIDKFHNVFREAKEAISRNDAAKAKKLYIEARNMYVGLNNKKKKDVYEELMELYNKLSK